MFEAETINQKILIAENTDEDRKNLLSFLGAKYQCDEVVGREAFQLALRETNYAVIVLCRDLSPASICVTEYLKASDAQIIVTGENISARETVEIFRAGATDFLSKPFNSLEVKQSVKNAFQKHCEQRKEKKIQLQLAESAARRSNELDLATEEIERLTGATLKVLVQALETRDYETHGHSERAVTFSLRLGREAGLDNHALKNLEFGALLHDVGKIGVPDAILHKPTALTSEEWNKMKLHPLYGQQLLRNIAFLEGASRIVAQHHERWDGAGYPHGLRGAEIDLGARVFAVADAFDAMTSDRIYRRGRSYESALEEIRKCAGTQFDPVLVEAFESVPREDWEILRRRSIAGNEAASFQTIVEELINARQMLEMIH